MVMFVSGCANVLLFVNLWYFIETKSLYFWWQLTWYAGPVFGNRDYFSGLSIFLDTYPNVGGEHGVSLMNLFIFVASCTYICVLHSVNTFTRLQVSWSRNKEIILIRDLSVILRTGLLRKSHTYFHEPLWTGILIWGTDIFILGLLTSLGFK